MNKTQIPFYTWGLDKLTHQDQTDRLLRISEVIRKKILSIAFTDLSTQDLMIFKNIILSHQNDTILLSFLQGRIPQFETKIRYEIQKLVDDINNQIIKHATS